MKFETKQEYTDEIKRLNTIIENTRNEIECLQIERNKLLIKDAAIKVGDCSQKSPRFNDVKKIDAPTKTAKEKYWCGPVPNDDDFGVPITDEFIDGRTIYGPSAFMSPTSFKTYGVGKLGPGYGQRYQFRASSNKWVKIEG